MNNSMFADISGRAKKASELAVTDLSNQLTEMFRDHLYQNGVPAAEVKQCRIIHRDEENRFVPEVTDRVNQMDLGGPTSPPMGLTIKFFNRLDVPKMHNAALFKASKEVGLL